MKNAEKRETEISEQTYKTNATKPKKSKTNCKAVTNPKDDYRT